MNYEEEIEKAKEIYLELFGLESLDDGDFYGCYRGWFESVEDFAYHFAEDINPNSDGKVTWPYNYVDWQAAGEALLMDDFIEQDGFYFWAHG